MVMRHGGGHGVRERRFPRKTQAGASVGKAARASSGGRGRKAPAIPPWIHIVSGPCGTRAVFAATSVAAHAGGKEHVTHRAVNIILQQSVTSNWLDTVYSLLMKSQHSSDVLKIVFLIEKT